MTKFSMPPLPPVFAELQQKVTDLMAQGAEGPKAEAEKHLRTALAAAIDRLDLVSREDFDQQQAVLERASAKLAELEARLAAFESAGRATSTSASPASPPTNN